MIMDNPGILLNNRWEDTAKAIITEFYKYAGKDAPEWIDYIMEEDVSGQSDEETELEIRAFLINAITEAYTKHFKTFSSIQQNNESDRAIQDTSIWSRLDFCLKNQLISYLHQHRQRGEEYPSIVITSDIMNVLKKYDMRNLTTLKDIADELDFEYKTIELSKLRKTIRAVIAPRDKFVLLLDAGLGSIDRTDEDR
jgi:hypothetical protein